MFVIFITPFFTENARRWLHTLTDMQEVRLGVISQENQDELPQVLQNKLAGHWRVDDALNSDQLTWAARELGKAHGQPHRLLTVNEQSQVPVAEARERLGIAGMTGEVALNFRDKARMKAAFRAAHVPCARFAGVMAEPEAWAFVEQVGYPICIKPVAGAAAQSTYRVENADMLREVLARMDASASGPSAAQPLQIEEFVTGSEHSLETISLNGQHLWHSLTHYHPTPLEAMRNPWIQWRIVLPREIDAADYDDIRVIGRQALDALGMQTGLSHLEWFRRSDGTIAVSEVGARPPGAQIVTLNCRAHDIDLYALWARLMIFDVFEPPTERKYAAGAAYLRGLGSGCVKAVHGLDEVLRDLGSMVTDVRRPEIGQVASVSYEGEGYVLVRHPDTHTVEDALSRIVAQVRVELVD